MSREIMLTALERLSKPETPDILVSSFPQQRTFIEDPARLKALFCTRRAAKSFTAGLSLFKTGMDHPETDSLFIGLTRDSARAIVWLRILKVIDRVYQLGTDFNETHLTATLPNGSVIKVRGADVDEEEMNKMLGGKYKLVCVDEASMYSISLRNMIYGVLKPAMTDLRGTIAMFGTSSNFPRGLFYDVTTGAEPGWSMHTWSAHDNPYVAKQWQEELDEIARERPLYMETPQFKQWYLNQWVVDEEKLVYRFNPAKNLVDKLPHLAADGWIYNLGVDLGWEDDNAFVLTAYHLNDPHLYIIKIFNRKKMTFDKVAAKIQEFLDDKSCSPSRVIIDGANKQGVESMRFRSTIPFEYADKQDKATFIELCNSDLIQGKIQIIDTQANQPLWDELKSLVWVTDGDKIRLPKKENPTLSNHLADAFLYAWRNGYHYYSAPAETKVVIGSKAWYEKQAEDIWEKERERLVEESEKDSWSEGDGWGRM